MDYFAIGTVVGRVVGAILFVALWIYCIATYGFLFGVGLGWLPSLITAWIVGQLLVLLWVPVAAIVVIGIVAGLALLLWENASARQDALGLAECVVVFCAFIGAVAAIGNLFGRILPKRKRRQDGIAFSEWGLDDRDINGESRRSK